MNEYIPDQINSHTIQQKADTGYRRIVIRPKKEHLYKGITLFMSFSLSFTNAAVVPQIFTQVGYGLQTGGPVVMVYGWIIVGIFTMITALSMAEICSAYPVAGSVYYWSGVLAPKKYSSVASYITGWFNMLANLANCASLAYGLSKILVGLQYMGHEGVIDPQRNTQIVITSIIILLVWTLKNSLRIDYQGIISDISSVYQILSTFILLAAIMVISTALSSTSFVFESYHNSSGFDNQAYVFSIGLLSSLYAFSGYEGSATLAEETQNANQTAHKGIIYTAFLSFIVGFVLILGILYGSQERIADILNGPSDASTNLFSIICGGQFSGTLLLNIILMVNIFLSGLSSITVSSRITYAICRDGALPYSNFFKKLDEVNQSPARINILLFIIQSLLCTLPLFSITAFTTIVQISTICFQISYAIPILLRVTSARRRFKQDYFNLGKFSIVFGWIAVTFLILTSIILLLPTQYDSVNGITLQNFNFTSIVLALVMAIAYVYWNLPQPYGAKYFFTGPTLKTMLDQEEFESDLSHEMKNYYLRSTSYGTLHEFVEEDDDLRKSLLK